jgi:hypothetical protein
MLERQTDTQGQFIAKKVHSSFFKDVFSQETLRYLFKGLGLSPTSKNIKTIEEHLITLVDRHTFPSNVIQMGQTSEVHVTLKKSILPLNGLRYVYIETGGIEADEMCPIDEYPSQLAKELSYVIIKEMGSIRGRIFISLFLNLDYAKCVQITSAHQLLKYKSYRL